MATKSLDIGELSEEILRILHDNRGRIRRIDLKRKSENYCRVLADDEEIKRCLHYLMRERKKIKIIKNAFMVMAVIDLKPLRK